MLIFGNYIINLPGVYYMEIFDKIKHLFAQPVSATPLNSSNQSSISGFERKHDLNSISGIRSITVSDARKWSARASGVPMLPEQILFKKATEHKGNNQIELAIECLRKANEILPHASCSYTRENYERLVNYLIIAERFDEARHEHAKLDKMYGGIIQNLLMLKEQVNETKKEKLEYQARIVDPKIQEERDREEYYWLLENMKTVAPKSFSGYRRMKTQKTQNYQKIVYLVESKGMKMSQIKFWL